MYVCICVYVCLCVCLCVCECVFGVELNSTSQEEI